MRIIVTGGCGFIGSHLRDLLADLGHEVLSIDDMSTGVDRGYQFIDADIRVDIIGLREGIRAATSTAPWDVMVHLAAKSAVNVVERLPAAYTANLAMTERALILAADLGCSRFVFASTMAVHGDHPPPALGPRSRYARSKLVCEYAIANSCEELGMTYAIARLGNVYGPRQRPDLECGVIAKWMDALRRGEDSIGVSGDGEQTRAFVYVSDVAEALADLATTRLPAPGGNVVTVAPLETETIANLAALVAKVSDTSPRVRSLPLPPGEVRTTHPPARGQYRRIGGYTPLEKGLEQTWDLGQ